MKSSKITVKKKKNKYIYIDTLTHNYLMAHPKENVPKIFLLPVTEQLFHEIVTQWQVTRYIVDLSVYKCSANWAVFHLLYSLLSDVYAH